MAPPPKKTTHLNTLSTLQGTKITKIKFSTQRQLIKVVKKHFTRSVLFVHRSIAMEPRRTCKVSIFANIESIGPMECLLGHAECL